MEGDIGVRPFEQADRDGIRALWNACGLVVSYNDPDADLDRAAGRWNSDVLVGVRSDNSLVATVMVGHDGHRGWLYYLAVDPARRGCGLGRVMVAAAEDWLRARRIPKVQLLIRETNAAVCSFYQRAGWSVAPRTVMERWLLPTTS